MPSPTSILKRPHAHAHSMASDMSWWLAGGLDKAWHGAFLRSDAVCQDIQRLLLQVSIVAHFPRASLLAGLGQAGNMGLTSWSQHALDVFAVLVCL